jgi:hypothetical protein
MSNKSILFLSLTAWMVFGSTASAEDLPGAKAVLAIPALQSLLKRVPDEPFVPYREGAQRPEAAASLTNTSASGTITLPIEVIGPNGYTASVSFTPASGVSLSGPLILYMYIHGLRSGTQASVQVNSGAWTAIASNTVTLLGNANAYGGIGGGFSSLQMYIVLPAGTIQAGSNTINFRFNQTDGRVSGFRVLGFNVLTTSGTVVIPSSSFVADNPNTWTPPLNDAADIAAGETLWHTASLTTPVTTGGTQAIVAHCSDCHAVDGRDLKFFNYSNNSIETRAQFHGLSLQQGEQIASYIRSLNQAHPGRPWNPPYQPGPGLDSDPVSYWSAGAGLGSVLDTDADMINAIFPSGVESSAFAPSARLDQREVPLTVQLPDWNQWLPGISPMDAFGSTFTDSAYNTVYQTLSTSLVANNPAVYVAQNLILQSWFGAFYGFVNQMDAPFADNPNGWNATSVNEVYGIPQWGMVKTWELMNEFQLQGYAQNIFGAQADPRAWYSNLPFFTSPHELKMPTGGAPGLRNGTAAVYTYLSYIWYNVQLILNDSNGTQAEQYPIDWTYVYASIQNLGELSSPQGGLQTLWMIKALEVMQQLGVGPQAGGGGFQPAVAQPSWLVTPEWNLDVWYGVAPATRTAIANGIAGSWLSEVQQYTPAEFYAGGWTTATAVPVAGGNAYDGVFPDWVSYMIPRLAFIGVSSSVVDGLASWAQSVWPDANWTAILDSTCSWYINLPDDPPGYSIQCTQ